MSPRFLEALPANAEPAALDLFKPGRIGSVQTANRFIRSATGESMADEHGVVSDDYIAFHLRLSRGGVGLIFTGHCYVERRGAHALGMTGLDSDEALAGLRRVTRAVHEVGTPIFAELNHAGSQARLKDIEPIAPSAIPNPQTGRLPRAATAAEIGHLLRLFGQAARRTREAGFDGVHLHAGHGYLLSEFLSPLSNRRTDEWGGSLPNRQRFLLAVVREVRAAVGPDFPVTVKLGVRDFVPGGLTFDEGLETAKALDAAGVQGIEISAGLTSPRQESAMQYAGLTRRRALEDKLIWRLFARPVPEAYFRHEARRVKAAVRCPVILVGGLRSIETMEAVIKDGTADFVSLARPLIREPELINEIRAGRRGLVDCTSCNICSQHEGVHSLRCWRKTNRDLAIHAYHRFTGKLH
jgi:2,4-dienoyl-CoA reductase-like NADH-dependent reductase (Old Yellow Enzyme family)